MKIIENEHEIIVIDTPIFYWILGTILSFVFAIAFFVWIYFAYQKPHIVFTIDFSNNFYDSLSSFFLFGLILLFIFLLFATFFFMVLEEKITVKVNRSDKIVELKRKGLLKDRTERFYFPQISHFESFTKPDRKLPELVLILSNEAKIHLEIRKQKPEEFAGLIQKLNSFITQ